jgi:protein ImuA
LRRNPALQVLHTQVEKIEGRRRRVKSVLPFRIAELNSRLPGGAWRIARRMRSPAVGNDAVNGAAAALFAAGIAARTRGKVLWCVSRSDLSRRRSRKRG